MATESIVHLRRLHWRSPSAWAIWLEHNQLKSSLNRLLKPHEQYSRGMTSLRLLCTKFNKPNLQTSGDKTRIEIMLRICDQREQNWISLLSGRPYLKLFFQCFVMLLGDTFEVIGKIITRNVGGFMWQSLKECLIDEDVLRQSFHHVEPLLSHSTEMSKDVNPFFFFSHVQHRIDQYESSSSSDSSGAVNNHFRIFLIKIWRTDSRNETNENARILRGRVVRPGNKVILHYYKRFLALINNRLAHKFFETLFSPTFSTTNVLMV